MERQPVEFLVNELPDHLAEARQTLGNYINAGRDDVVYVPNATFGVNVVARSLKLGRGDEVLTTNHEYGACSRVWQFLSQKHGFEVGFVKMNTVNELTLNKLKKFGPLAFVMKHINFRYLPLFLQTNLYVIANKSGK